MESHTDRRAMLAAAAGLGGLAMLTRPAGAGPLTPPGAPGSTGRTIAEVYDGVRAAGGSRTPISDVPPGDGFLHKITQPGAYVLTSDIVVAGDLVIRVAANDVDIDLNGHSIINSSIASGTAINASAGFHRTRVHNGAIRGSFSALWLNSEAIIERLRISGFGSRGITMLDDSIVRDCLVRGGNATQVFAGHRCVLHNSSFIGANGVSAGDSLHVDRCTFEDTSGFDTGIVCGINARISSCIVRGYSVAGITTNDSSIVEGCMLNNNGDGVVVSDNCLVRKNNIDFHPLGNGIKVQGSRTRLVENHICRAATGVLFLAGDNIGYGNTVFDCTVINNGSGNSFPLVTLNTAWSTQTPFVNIRD